MGVRSLSATDLLDAAEVCRGRPAAEAAIYLAAVTRPELSLAECARLGIGTRDDALVALRAAMFGERLDLGATCPACAGQLDVTVTTDALAQDAPTPSALPTLRLDGRRFRLRPADSCDLAAIAQIDDPDEARETLARRCLTPTDGGAPPRLDGEGLATVAAALADLDPAADPYVPLTCGACGHAWDAPIDIARILACEIEAAADALIDDVHDLALAYHWTEAAILALPAERRRAYLERLRA